MGLALGIDTGGTYTDAVLVEQQSGEVLTGAKALTTRRDLAVGIGQVLQTVVETSGPAEIGLVGLSTTLATNAIVEGQGSPVCLILVGYDRQLVRGRGYEGGLATEDLVYINGGHDGAGVERAELDEGALRRAVGERRGRVAAFAVSSYFGVRNRAHELRARQIIEQLTADWPAGPLPVTCGHELSDKLDSLRRATTAALNARLVPLLQELIATVRRVLDELGIAAPLMVVRGDGSLVRADWAEHRPIETVLSGPAASVVGAWHLAGRRDAWVVDVGGTTTDIALLRDGRPRLSPEGARVGRWRTMIETVDVATVGLGGDSHVHLVGGAFEIGPRRVVPLCLLASEYPEVFEELRRQRGQLQGEELAGQFALGQGRVPAVLDRRAGDLLARLDSRPRSLVRLCEEAPFGRLLIGPLERLEAGRLVLRAGFTPTDALHVLGRFARWDAAASVLGAELLAAYLGCAPAELCERIVAAVSDRLTGALVGKVLGDETGDWESAQRAEPLLERARGEVPDSDLQCRLSLRRPLVAIGAPVGVYLPRTAAQLDAELIVPPHAAVANAVGAVAGGVVQSQRVLVRPGGAAYQVLSPDGVRPATSVEEGVNWAEAEMPERLRALCLQAGAEQVEVRVARQDHNVPVESGGDEEVFVETELVFTALGRPGMAEVRES